MKPKKCQHGRAIAGRSAVIRLSPVYADAFLKRRNRCGAKTVYGKSIAVCGEAIKLDPQVAVAFYQRGCAWANQDERDKARAVDRIDLEGSSRARHCRQSADWSAASGGPGRPRKPAPRSVSPVLTRMAQGSARGVTGRFGSYR